MKLCMLPCLSCHVYGTWRSKEVEGLMSSYGGKRGKPQKGGFLKGDHKNLPGTPQLTYLSYLPIAASFGVKTYRHYITAFIIKTS